MTARFFFLLALTLVAVKCTAGNSHLLRIQEENRERKDESSDDTQISGGSFSIEKGYKCEGGFEHGKGGHKHCEGGVRQTFSMGYKADEIARDIASELKNEVEDFMPELEGFFPGESAMEEMMTMDDEDLLDSELDFSKTVKFGGMMKLEWGCNVTYEVKSGKFSKKSECGFRGVGDMGPSEDGNVEDTEL